MKTLNLTQGSPQWHAARANHFCASEAPAMLGVSKYTTRSDLLRQKHTGLTEVVDAGKQRLFDAGHRAEAAARPIAEAIIGQDLYPVVGTLEINGLNLLASLDGCVMDETIIWETKLWNESLAQACVAGDLEPHYWAQLEHQLLVSGADTALFTTSDGTDEHTELCWYKSVPERRSQILSGWEQFSKDLAEYTPEFIEVTPVGRTPESLPALHIEVTGMVTASNLAEYKAHALAVFASVNRDLVTDQDFADAKKAVKWAGDIETRLKAAKEHALSQTESIDVLFKTIDDITEEARRVRLELNNLVKTRETNLRTEIINGGREALDSHLSHCNIRLGRHLMPAIAADFAGAIKGMSKFDNMRNAVATELARAKIEANAVADKIATNMKAINEQKGFEFLFYDLAQLVLKDPEFVDMAIKSRIAEHQAKEAARIEADRARIAAEERAKAEASERARADAEIAEATAKAQAEAAIASAASITQQFEDLEKSEIKRLANLNNSLIVEVPRVEAVDVLSNPTLKLGQIADRLGFQLTAEFLRHLGFEPAAIDKNARLYHENDFPRMCAVLVRHIQKVSQGVAA